MEETSNERLVRSGNREITTVDDDAVIILSSQDNPAARYQRMLLELDEQLLQMRLELPAFGIFGRPVEPEIFPMFLPLRYPDFLDLRVEEEEEEDLLLGGASQRPELVPRKTRRRRDPPPHVSRRSSQVSPPIYLRHRFLPPSRKQSSSRRQR